MVFFKPHHCVADVVGCGLDVVVAVVLTFAWRRILLITISGTPKRYRLLPSSRLAACQPCHSGIASSE